MFKLSTYIAKLEDRWGKKLGRLWEKHKGKWNTARLTAEIKLGSIAEAAPSGLNGTGNRIS